MARYHERCYRCAEGSVGISFGRFDRIARGRRSVALRPLILYISQALGGTSLSILSSTSAVLSYQPTLMLK